MVRNLLLSICLFGTSAGFAQVSITPIKTPDKPLVPQIDYKQPGAAMPSLKYIVYRDTVKKTTVDASGIDTNFLKMRHTARPANNNNAEETKSRNKKARKHKEYDSLAVVNAGIIKPVLTNQDFDNGANLFVVMFNPTCSHCQDETMMLGKNADLFKRSKVVYVASPVMKMYIPDFIKYTHFEQYPFMYLGIDSSDFINNVFLYQSLPQINIYDKHRKLLKIYSGEVAIDSLEKYIE